MNNSNQSGKIRKEIHLEQTIINKLQHQADKDGRSLKNYMEQILIHQSKSTQPIK